MGEKIEKSLSLLYNRKLGSIIDKDETGFTSFFACWR